MLDVIAGYSRETMLASTDPSVTHLLEAAESQNVAPFGTFQPLQRGPLMGLCGEMPQVQPQVQPQGAGNFKKSKSGHKSGYCKYCLAHFERLTLHKCKLAPEVEISNTIFLSSHHFNCPIVSDASLLCGTQKENVAQKKRKEDGIGSDLKTRLDELLLEVLSPSIFPHQELVCLSVTICIQFQYLIHRGYNELGLEVNLQMYSSNRSLLRTMCTPQIHCINSVIGNVSIPPFSA